jgi:hypothetical protein
VDELEPHQDGHVHGLANAAMLDYVLGGKVVATEITRVVAETYGEVGIARMCYWWGRAVREAMPHGPMELAFRDLRTGVSMEPQQIQNDPYGIAIVWASRLLVALVGDDDVTAAALLAEPEGADDIALKMAAMLYLCTMAYLDRLEKHAAMEAELQGILRSP